MACFSKNSSSVDVFGFLRQECGLCSDCSSFVVADHDISPLTINHHRRTSFSSSSSSSSSGESDDDRCTVCFGLLSPSYQTKHILPIIEESLLPYCRVDDDDEAARRRRQRPGFSSSDDRALVSAERGNHLTRESPTVNLPWSIAVRAHCAVVAARGYLANNEATGPQSGGTTTRLRSAEEVYLRIKEQLRSSLSNAMLEGLTASDDEEDEDGGDDDSTSESRRGAVVLSEELHEEEAGYLGVHVLVLPPTSPAASSDDGSNDENDVTQLIPPSFREHVRENKRQILQSYYRILHPRKRFRGNDPTLKQGGDPRNNLELRVRRSGNQDKNKDAAAKYSHGGGRNNGSNGYAEKKQKLDNPNLRSVSQSEWNMIVPWLEKNTVLQWLEEDSSRVGDENGDGRSDDLSRWLRELHQGSSRNATNNSPQKCSVHAASFRRPFYVQGTYTKSRRDVSQTPFYVPAPSPESPGGETDGVEVHGGGRPNQSHNAMVRKGVSSVEEEICPPLARIGCGGISERNNERPPKTEQGKEDSEKGAVVYGLCKFHASGREDMDVRMLLPPPSVAEASAESGVVITGRPFVCEIYDAHKIPSKRDLDDVARAINRQDGASHANGSSPRGKEGIKMDEKDWPTALVGPDRYHGSNPGGVGVGTHLPLSLVSSDAFSGLQSETEEKVKLYGCVCHTSAPIASEEELLRRLGCSAWNKEGEKGAHSDSCIYPLEIRQSTPLRVLHRRSSDVRTRHVLSLSAQRIDDHWFRLRMSTSAGTYVKEFVHGDCGRTQPNIGSMLGGRTDITELDCEGIAF